ncbi:hypothetical protein [Serratia marcescens]|uniref:hypothetical protein n=1 Tax=Serratia marcescens TaxID=615 RepID=UPI00217AB370|nr:hypothetical protein [Serratia marcescens]CAI1191744.1 Uncharacterised protein [Serratia marcescens]
MADADSMYSERLWGQVATSAYRHVAPPLSIVVVDGCRFGQLGLAGLLTVPALSTQAVSVSTHARVEEALAGAYRDRAGVEGACAGRCLVLRLPGPPLPALQQLLCLENESLVRAGFGRLVILSPFEGNNVIRQVLVCGGIRMPVRIVDARSPVTWLRRVVLSQGSLQQAGDDELLPQMPALILSPPERRVLAGTLSEISIPQQARRLHRNNKTLYAQRHSALHKLRSPGVAALLRRFVSM